MNTLLKMVCLMKRLFSFQNLFKILTCKALIITMRHFVADVGSNAQMTCTIYVECARVLIATTRIISNV